MGHCSFPDLGGILFSVPKLQAVVPVAMPQWPAALSFHASAAGDGKWVAAACFSWCPNR